MHPQPYLLVYDRDALRLKLKRAKGSLALLWRSIQAQPYAAGNGAYFNAFCYLATGKESYARAAIAELKKALHAYRAGDRASVIHFHTWCNAMPLARLAIAFDWVADSPALAPSDAETMRETLIDYAMKHPASIARSRALTSDNQIGGMSFCNTLVGYLFGVKRGADPRAQRLLAEGAMRFPDLLALAPPAGYSLEGSTYFAQIVVPLLSLFAVLMEQITGEDHVSRRYGPGGHSVAEALDTYRRLIGPSGLLPAWDHYHWMTCCSTMGLALLTRKTGDPRPLRLFDVLHLALESRTILWGSDDRLWTALWWPDEPVAPSASDETFESWALPQTAGALVDAGPQWRLFQYWDQCGAGIHCSRAQVNPNAVTLEAWGVPLLTDGTPTDDCLFFNYPPESLGELLTDEERRSHLSYLKTFSASLAGADRWVRSFSPGLLGASNSIVIEKGDTYAPSENKTGSLVAFGALPGLKLVSSQAASFYQPRYPVESMIRTSLMVRSDYLLMLDSIRTRGPRLSFQWQAFATGAASARGSRTHLETEEGVHLDILPIGFTQAPELTEAPGFPREGNIHPHAEGSLTGGQESRSTRVRYSKRGRQVDFPFLLVPSRRMKPVADLEEGWTWSRLDKNEGLAVDCHRGAMTSAPLPLELCGLAAAKAGRDGWAWAGRSFMIPKEAARKRLFLRFASPVLNLHVWVNGDLIHAPDASRMHDRPGIRYTPLVVEITAPLKALNSVSIGGMTQQGKLVTRGVELLAETAAPALPKVRTTGVNRFEIRGDWGVDEIALNPDGATALQASDAEATAQALLLMRGQGFSAIGATTFQQGKVSLQSDRPVNIAVEQGRVTLGDLGGPVSLTLSHPDFHLVIESRGVLDVILVGKQRPLLIASLPDNRPVFLNGVLTPVARDPFSGHLCLDPRLPPDRKRLPLGKTASLRAMERLLALAALEKPERTPALIAGLRHADWRVRMLAADLVGRTGCKAATPALLALLAGETPDRLYRNDRLVKWEDAIEQWADPADPDRGDVPDEGDRRQRVKTAIIEALGRLRAVRAVPALCRIIRDQREFYPVHSLACKALGLIGDSAALPTLKKAARYSETNTRSRARDAISRLTTGQPECPGYPDMST